MTYRITAARDDRTAPELTVHVETRDDMLTTVATLTDTGWYKIVKVRML